MSVINEITKVTTEEVADATACLTQAVVKIEWNCISFSFSFLLCPRRRVLAHLISKVFRKTIRSGKHT